MRSMVWRGVAWCGVVRVVFRSTGPISSIEAGFDFHSAGARQQYNREAREINLL